MTPGQAYVFEMAVHESHYNGGILEKLIYD